MKLAELMAAAGGPLRIEGDGQSEIIEIRDDSRRVEAGDLFVSIPTEGGGGRDRGFLAEAIQRGASALVLQTPPPLPDAGSARGPLDLPVDFTGAVARVADARHALAKMAAHRFATDASPTLMAVTGTNGKTTTTFLLESMLAAAGIRAGVIGTISYRVRDSSPSKAGSGSAAAAGSGRALSRVAPLTTPGAIALHALLADMRAVGATDVVLEASSHALAQRRLDGCRFRVAGLTNLTQDHLDFHGTMERYLDAKAILFERLLDHRSGVAVLPMDRPEGRALRARLRGGQAVLGIASTPASPPRTAGGVDVAVESARPSADGVRARLATPIGRIDIDSRLVGDYNLANITLAVAMAIARGVPKDAIVSGIEALAGVPGRLERIPNSRGVLVVVDYAHTPDALERATAALRPLVGRGGRLITLFGCGGGRDRAKRPLMGRAAVEGSDLVVITSDNPRDEDPLAIIEAILEGAARAAGEPELGGHAAGPSSSPSSTPPTRKRFEVEPDRRTAIRVAVAASRAGDVVLLAGKGHEDYQILGSTRVHFDDREEAALALALARDSGDDGDPQPSPGGGR